MNDPSVSADSVAPPTASREPSPQHQSIASPSARRAESGLAGWAMACLVVSAGALSLAMAVTRPWEAARTTSAVSGTGPHADDAEITATGPTTLAAGSDVAVPVGSDVSSPPDPSDPAAPATLPLRYVAQALLAAPGPKQRAMVFQIAHHPIEQVVLVIRRFLQRPDLERDAAFEAIYWLKLHGDLGTRTLLQLYPDLDAWRRTMILEVCAVYRNEGDPELIRGLKLAFEDPHYERWEQLMVPIPRTVGSSMAKVGRPGGGCPCHPR